MFDNRLSKVLRLYSNDIFAFVRNEFGVVPTRQQAELLKAIQEGKSATIRSGHGTGKSASLSWILLWFLLTKPYSKVIATAPTRRQLRDVLWAEAKMWLNRSTVAKALIDAQVETFRVVGSDSWFARAVSINVKDSPEQQAETLAGYHAPHLLVIVDEASGVPDPVFNPLEGMLTTSGTQIVLAGNPTRTGNYFHRSHVDPYFEKFYVRLHWNSEESENVSEDWIRMMQEKYGKDSAVYKIRVLGEFVEHNEMKLITDEKLFSALWHSPEECRPVNENLPFVVGIDTAKLNDFIAIAFRQGNCIVGVETVEPSDIPEIACSRVLEKLADKSIYSIAVDTTGGYGDRLFDCLKQRFGRIVYGINFSWKAKQNLKYVNYRDEMYGELFEAMASGQLKVVDDPRLVRQLQATAKHFVYDEKLRIKLRPKTELKLKLGESPDLADAVALTMTEPLNYGGKLRWSGKIKHSQTKMKSWLLR